MTGSIFVAAAVAMICAVIILIIRDMMLCPVKAGKNTIQYVLLAVNGKEPALENNLRSLLWLNENKILRCTIIVYGKELDFDTRSVAKKMEADYECIHFIEDGDMPQWIRNLNF